MRKPRRSLAAAVWAAVFLALSGPAEVRGQELRGSLEIGAAASTGMSSLRRFDALVETLAAGGELVLAASRPDSQLQGRTQQFFQQYHEGVPVLGAGVSRQLAGGATVSLLGTIETGIELDPQPRFQSVEALELLEQQTGVGALSNALPELIIVQVPTGRYVLAYQVTMRDLRTYYLDAHSGFIAHDVSAAKEQTVGAGNGILGQPKKLSTSRSGGTYQAYDRLRPAEIITLDLRYDAERLEGLLLGDVVWASSDVASDADNTWTDPAVVDAHAYIGFTYDYLATRQDWRGIDGRDGRIFSMVNIERGFDNAFFAFPPFGPGDLGVFGFGEVEDGPPIVSVDTVGHELMHAVTYHSTEQRTGTPLIDSYWFIPGPASFTLEEPSRFVLQAGVHECGQVYTWDSPIREEFMGREFRFWCNDDGRFALMANEGGALHESWSDMFAAAVEFMVHDPPQGPLRADYELGEDTPPAIRSMERPRAWILEGTPGPHTYPDAAGDMVRFLVGIFEDNERAFFSPFISLDGENIQFVPSIFYDGVHWNSTVLSHAFYLAIEGGTHETSGLTVPGVGGDRRHDIERVFFRAMTELMPPGANVVIAALAVRVTAIDLFGAGSDVFAAVHQALNAVGLPIEQNDE
ncbi:MAG: M4 family metallopeptidase [Acidobacteria bacterium]|nr:M4 family metallopeptidase [Acidobacteriota bacterium]